MGNGACQGNLARGIIVGTAAGLVGTLAMTAFQTWLNKAQPTSPPSTENEEPATEQAADAISEKAQGHDLPEDQREQAGNAVHLTMGATCGAIYGALSEFVPAVTALEGVGYGSCVWLVADNFAVPELGLAKPPTERPTPDRVKGFLAHVVYGLTMDITRRVLNGVFAAID